MNNHLYIIRIYIYIQKKRWRMVQLLHFPHEVVMTHLWSFRQVLASPAECHGFACCHIKAPMIRLVTPNMSQISYFTCLLVAHLMRPHKSPMIFLKRCLFAIQRQQIYTRAELWVIKQSSFDCHFSILFRIGILLAVTFWWAIMNVG